MTNGTGNGTTPSPPDEPPLPVVASNGIKLFSETIVPGGSLLLEKKVGNGLAIAGVGLFGAAALGAAFGPMGYLLARVGASALSYSTAIAPPPPPPNPNAVAAAAATAATTAVTRQLSAMAAQPAFRAAAESAPADMVTRAEFQRGLDQILAEIKDMKNTPASRRAST
jgi:hypothetical protein